MMKSAFTIKRLDNSFLPQELNNILLIFFANDKLYYTYDDEEKEPQAKLKERVLSSCATCFVHATQAAAPLAH